MRPLVLLTRGSPLARRQADLAAAHLGAALGRPTEIRIVVTTGDRQAAWSLEKQGGKGLFTAELEQGLLRGEGDLAIHSAKDLPTEMPRGLAIAGFLPREDARDILVRRESIATRDSSPRVALVDAPKAPCSSLGPNGPSCAGMLIPGFARLPRARPTHPFWLARG